MSKALAVLTILALIGICGAAPSSATHTKEGITVTLMNDGLMGKMDFTYIGGEQMTIETQTALGLRVKNTDTQRALVGFSLEIQLKRGTRKVPILTKTINLEIRQGVEPGESQDCAWYISKMTYWNNTDRSSGDTDWLGAFDPETMKRDPDSDFDGRTGHVLATIKTYSDLKVRLRLKRVVWYEEDGED